MEYTGILTPQELNDLTYLLNEAVKANGLVGDCDIKARIIINKFAPKTEKTEPK